MNIIDTIARMNKIKPVHPQMPRLWKKSTPTGSMIQVEERKTAGIGSFRNKNEIPSVTSFANKSADKTITSKRKDDFGRYKSLVWELTEKVKHLIPGIEKRSWKGYHIDHKIPIAYGFKRGIAASIIGDVGNLRMIPCKENMLKGQRFCPIRDAELSVMKHSKLGLIIVK